MLYSHFCMYCEAAKSGGNLLCLLLQGQAECLYEAPFVTVLKMQIYLCVVLCVFVCFPLRPQVQELMLESYSAAYNRMTHMLGLKHLCKITLCDSNLLILLAESH